MKKQAAEPWPWTSDPILQSFKFTNPFRQNDRVTKEWTTRYARLLSVEPKRQVTDAEILWHVCMFRLFNYPGTYDALRFNMKRGWDEKKAVAILKERRDGENSPDTQIFTGAYIVTPGGSGDKIETYCKVLSSLWDGRSAAQKKKTGRKKILPRVERWARIIRKRQSMRRAVALLCKLDCVGPFIAYEIVCDLRHTRLLADAKDVNSWANAGPGAERGIHRLLTGKFKWTKGNARPDYNLAMRDLLRISQQKGVLSKEVRNEEHPFEMREIEHSLCEFDKHSRVRLGEGKPRSTYSEPQKLPWEE